MDPTYEPDNSKNDVDTETLSDNDMTFSLVEEIVEESTGNSESDDDSMEESDTEIICTGEKRKTQDIGNMLATFEAEEISEYAEACAQRAAATAHRFWSDTTGWQPPLEAVGHLALTPPLSFSEGSSEPDTPLPNMKDIPTSPLVSVCMSSHTIAALEANPTTPNELHQICAATFLDITEDDSDAADSAPVLECVNKLIVDAKKFKSFTPLFYPTPLKQLINLWEKYQQNPQIRAPMMKASHTIAVSVGKGPYMAQKIHSLYKYVACF
ncbi:hypothetical protein EDD16DRAFT_1699566 [Pisolithus croceorrhizus]|nr:hypothetical protein EDD16DRAFT_1699566 [Pisolithus croceorrhizus]KAI6168751.1 hypothetical protein EDD17DRAFT_1750341 [Pisolithus thermaeus]